MKSGRGIRLIFNVERQVDEATAPETMTPMSDDPTVSLPAIAS
ncbi:hypothetical protein [Bradyrhizobium symbiodeficiens]|nr:hypothetical protein [Bradyrhizobium symbiodeficiens]